MIYSNRIISADRSQMELVFSNIIKNSVEAIKCDGNILVTIESNPFQVSFADDGAGLSKKATEGVFTPFFNKSRWTGNRFNSCSGDTFKSWIYFQLPE